MIFEQPGFIWQIKRDLELLGTIDAVALKHNLTPDMLLEALLDHFDKKALPPSEAHPSDKTLRSEMRRLRDREASLVTVCNGASQQLDTVQRRIKSLARIG